MAHASTLLNYQKRLQKVIDHIYDHLDEQIDLNRLADIACVSPHHWHRIYFGIYGETIASTVKRLRLHKAAANLAYSNDDISTIASTSGYKSLHSFTRAFSEVYGMPPARYRKQGSHTQFSLTTTNNETSPMNNTRHSVSFKHVKSFSILAHPHTGSYMNIGNAFEKLFGWLGMRGLIGPDMKSIAIYYDDPDSKPVDELRSCAGAVLPNLDKIDADSPMEKVVIESGEYAVLRFTGPYSDMHSAYGWLYGEWLPNSGREVSDAPCFEEYLNNPREVAPTELITDIYLPLK